MKRKTAPCGNFIGIDIGGTKTRIGYLDHNCKVVVLGQFPTEQNPDLQIEKIIELLRSEYDMAACHSIGIASPGPLNQKTGTILSPPNLQQWDNFKICEELKNTFPHAKVQLENDANCGALGEALFGAGKGYETVFDLMPGTGLGAGLVINGKLHIGYKGLATEVWCFDPMSFFGKKGKYNLNDLVSGNGFVKQMNDRIAAGEHTSVPKDKINTYEIFAAWEKGDPMAIDIVNSACDYMAATAVFAINMLAPDIIVMGGGIMHNPDWLFNPVKQKIKEILPLDDLKSTRIELAQLGSDMVIYGTVGLFSDCLNRNDCIIDR